MTDSRELQRVREIHQLVGVVVRERSQKHGIHDGEHRGRRTDAECESERRRNREGGSAPQSTQGVSDLSHATEAIKCCPAEDEPLTAEPPHSYSSEPLRYWIFRAASRAMSTYHAKGSGTLSP